MSTKPSVLILGGLNTCSRALAALLVPLDGEPLVAHLRIVDKYSVSPPTTYLGAEFPKLLEKPNVEYRQANLQIAAAVATCFEPPEGQEPYSYVFDLTGEISSERTEQIYIKTTFSVARLVALEAARRKVKAYVRLQQPVYDCKEKGSHDEKEDVTPYGDFGTWWHETLRMLSTIDDLNLVILRTALVYGPYVNFGTVMGFIAVASVYGYIKEPMKALWGPGKHPTHTVHVDDVAGALWACAEWMAKTGRAEANSLAGEEITFSNNKKRVQELQTEGLEGLVGPDKTCIAPCFNLEDDSNVTMADLGNVITSFFGTTFEFHNFIMNTVAKFKLDEVIDEINEEHVTRWNEMVAASNPPLDPKNISTYTAYMEKHHLRRHVVAFNAQKLKEIVGYKLKRPNINHETLKEIIDKLKAERTWPNLQSS